MFLPNYPRISHRGFSAKAGFDVKLGSEDDLDKVLDCLAEKGVCVIDATQELDILEGAAQQAQQIPAKYFRSLPSASGVHSAHAADGLLGSEGSRQVCRLAQAVSELEGAEEVGWLRKLEALSKTLCVGLAELCYDAVGEASSLSEPLLLEAQTPNCGSPAPEEMTEDNCSQWMNVFSRHRLQLLLFLGPGTGTLELGLFDEDQAKRKGKSRVVVRTRPGMLVLLRPDVVSRRHIASPESSSRCFACSQFMLASKVQDLKDDDQFVPYMEDLLAWVMARLAKLKELELEQNEEALAGVPKAWLRAATSEFDGEQASIKGSACRLPGPSGWWADGFTLPSFGGADYIVEIPHKRFDVEKWSYIDPEEDQWQENKTYCRHCSFVDGADMFDHQFFGINQKQVGTMPLSERWSLEVGYEALHDAGYNKTSLKRLKGDVLVGLHTNDNQLNYRTPESASFGIGGSQAKEANLLSFHLNLIGQSLVIDTDGSSSLAALHHAQMEQSAEQDEPLGDGRGAPFSLVLSSCWNVAPSCFANFCFRRLLSVKGRCFSFDADADGFVRGEGSGCLIIARLIGKRDPDAKTNDNREGLIRSVEMMQSGRGASLTAAAGVAMQEVMDVAALRGSCGKPGDIDWVECHASGNTAADALEAAACARVLRKAEPDASQQSLPLTSFKTLNGSAYAAAGLLGLLRSMRCARWLLLPANNMLRQLNPHLEAAEVNGVAFPTESTALRDGSSAVAVGLAVVNSFGTTGSYGSAVVWADVGEAFRERASEKRPKPAPWVHANWPKDAS